MDAAIRKICEILRCSKEDFDNGLERNQTASWDSLAHMEIIFALEEYRGHQLSTEVIAELNCSAKIEEVIASDTNG